MNKQFNKTTEKKEWILNTWWDKTIYVCGVIYVVIIGASFVYGFLEGLGL